MPCDRRAPVMSDNHGSLFTERIEHADHVADEVKQRVALDFGGPIRSSRSRACRVQRRESPPRQRAAVDGATNTRTPEIHGRAAPTGRCPARRYGCECRWLRRVRCVRLVHARQRIRVAAHGPSSRRAWLPFRRRNRPAACDASTCSRRSRAAMAALAVSKASRNESAPGQRVAIERLAEVGQIASFEQPNEVRSAAAAVMTMVCGSLQRHR